MTVQKEQNLDVLSIPIVTNGTDVFVKLADGTTPTLMMDDPSEDRETRNDHRLYFNVNVPNLHPSQDFEVLFSATFWNALQEQSTFVGIPIYSDAEEASIIVIWPDGMTPPAVHRLEGTLKNVRGSHSPAEKWGSLEYNSEYDFTMWHAPGGSAGSAAILNWNWPAK